MVSTSALKIEIHVHLISIFQIPWFVWLLFILTWFILHVGRPAPNRPMGVFCIAVKLGELVFDRIFRFEHSSLIKWGPNKAVLGLLDFENYFILRFSEAAQHERKKSYCYISGGLFEWLKILRSSTECLTSGKNLMYTWR